MRCAGRWGFGARLAPLATLLSVVLMKLRKSDNDTDAVTANARNDDLTGTIFAGHHQPLRVWILCLYFMGLNLSNSQIAKELELDPDSAHEMATLLRNGILAKEPEVTLSGEVECDEVYIVAGHKRNPEAVKKKIEKGVEGV